MSAEIHILPIPPQKRESPSAEVRVAEWREFDMAGVNLPKRSTAAEWSTARIVANVAAIAAATGLFWILFRSIGLVVIGLGGAFALPSRFLRSRAKQRLFRKALGEENPSCTVIGVSYQIHGYEYGRDFGRLCLEKGWLFFEGERSSFSLGRQDAAPEFKQPTSWVLGALGFGGQGSTALQLLHTQREVTIQLEPVSGTHAELRNEVYNWRTASEPTEGIALLPPLQLNPSNDFAQHPQWRKSLWAGVMGVCLVDMLTRWTGISHANLVLWSLCAFGAATFGVASDRLRVRKARESAFRRLSDLQDRIERSSACFR